MKRPNTYIVVLSLLFIVAIVVQLTRPKPVSWENSFARQDRIPFGGYILYDLLPELFPSSKVEIASMPIYNTFGEAWHENATYMVLNLSFTPDDLDLEELLEFVEDGNRVFVAAQSFSDGFADTLGFEVQRAIALPLQDSVELMLVNPALGSPNPYRYQKNIVTSHFSRFDTAKSVVLGTTSRGEVNYIRLPYGQGEFFISTVPYAFTNYNLVHRNNAEYAFGALAYLPDGGTLIWDEYYKVGRRLVRTPLRYILSQEPLRWAYYLTMAAVLLFIVFMGRRRQRIIPEIRPLPNTTLEFVETVGQLYYQHGDHKNIAEKRIVYLLEHIRSRFGVNTGERDEGFYHAVSARSGADLDMVKGLFGYIDDILQRETINEETLIALNSAIERFHSADGT